MKDINRDINNIYEEHSKMVTYICRKLLNNDNLAQDAAQEVWIEIIKSIESFNGSSKLSTWIYTVAYRTVMKFAKKEPKYTTKFLSNYFRTTEKSYLSECSVEKDIWIKEECDKCLTGTLQCLSLDNRLMYLLRDIVELSYEQISDIMSKDIISIRKSVSRSRRKLKDFLNNECILYNPQGKCNCRMKKLVTEINLLEEYSKIRVLTKKVNLYLESYNILPKKDYWHNLLDVTK